MEYAEWPMFKSCKPCSNLIPNGEDVFFLQSNNEHWKCKRYKSNLDNPPVPLKKCLQNWGADKAYRKALYGGCI